jgi:hypothetical protein
MSSSIRNKTSADFEQEQLKLKLEQYRCSNKPSKSILKPGGSGAAVITPASKRSLHTGCNENAHPVLPITPKFKATEMSTSKSRSRPTEPSAVAAESHLQAILKKILTDANSLANINRIQEVASNVCSSPTFFSDSVVGYFSCRPNHLFGPK